MVTVGASGREVSLTAGDYRARIVTVGAGLAGLTYRGHELIIPHSVDECPPAYLGKVLMPWPNRIAEGTYSWEGTSYDLPVNEHAFGTSLHGFVAFQEWGNRRGRHLLGAPAHSHPGALLLPVDARCVRSLQPGSGARPRRRTVGNEHPARAPPPTASDSIPTWLSTVYGWMIWSLRIPRRLSTRPTASMIPVAPHDVASFGLDFRSHALIGAPSGPRVRWSAGGHLDCHAA